MNKRTQKASKSFIKTLKSILENDEYSSIIQCTPENDGFIILDQKSLENIILPQHYKIKSFDSFRRSLNIYGFQVKKRKDGKKLYYNKNNNFSNETTIKRAPQKLTQENLDLLDQTNLQLYFQLMELKQQQESLFQQTQKVIQLQQLISNQMKNLLIRYSKGAIYEMALVQKFPKFFLMFFQSLQNQTYKKHITKSIQLVTKQFHTAQNPEIKLPNTNNVCQLLSKHLQQFKFNLSFNIQLLFNNLDQPEEIEQSIHENESNFSNYFCLNQKQNNSQI
ncbi:unnamed protein product (macronuclear) [Paramecium tetraurelia]|uniref:HSF-type DNA-binding domain-containing protein n=1 Tax=Paramecium tetraurelia TaxID=5888 RepID=A0DB67_PARTE|nr:uncharacterized protein GSPATT00015178001 [Paramecium tetraurelia]CAK80284.1 unnamed protein product [Paramecium tetraurelia]|eukprot:XP_001447681.1 hypothetical protein (macronuclear) [Paramecium tetraurelia strain d4-2]